MKLNLMTLGMLPKVNNLMPLFRFIDGNPFSVFYHIFDNFS
jgi:hypothetical protein